jgi:hypothetical protein
MARDPRADAPPRWLAIAVILSAIGGVALGLWLFRFVAGG